MKKLLATFAFLFTVAMAYRYSTDRMRAQLMGAAHPAGAMAEVRVPRKRSLFGRSGTDRFDYQAASSTRDHMPLDERQLADVPLSATPDVAPRRTRAKSPD